MADDANQPPAAPPAPRPRHNGAPDRRCQLCGRMGRRGDLSRVEVVRPQVANHIAATRKEWTGAGFICRRCLAIENGGYVVAELERERGELSTIELELARRSGESLLVAEHLDEEFQRTVTFGQRMADATARIGGSWGFVLGFTLILVVWIALNSFALANRAFDPFPYILLNLVLSCLAALQAPIIMMAQNRQAARDRAQADQDFRVNLKAEIAIMNLHEKIDHLLHSQWERLLELQQIQIDMLSDLEKRRRP
ncbi:MAG: DUF1003 domain-containing protein [Deltaproteobacteria bacterium]|nr:DUF1003 domain-containing protein [Deltaproteobacteria bacterium]